MKPFKEILEEVMKDMHISTTLISPLIAERAAIKYASQAIDECAAAAKIEYDRYDDDAPYVDIYSILSVKSKLK